MKRITLLLIYIAFSFAVVHAQGTRLADEPHAMSATVPSGWEQVRGDRHETVFKLTRSDGAGRRAIIVVALDNVEEGCSALGYDIWNMSDDELRKEAEGASMLGEPVNVIDVGRADIGGVHVIFHITRRTVPDSELWEFVYKGVRGSEYITIRLTSFGEQGWFKANQRAFADFVRSLRFDAR
jgi:hypothetical protein